MFYTKNILYTTYQTASIDLGMKLFYVLILIEHLKKGGNYVPFKRKVI